MDKRPPGITLQEVIWVGEEKENQPGIASVRMGRIKALYRKQRNSLHLSDYKLNVIVDLRIPARARNFDYYYLVTLPELY